MAQPLACFLPLLVKPKRLSIIAGLTALSIVITALLSMLALQSPNPLLKQSPQFSWLGTTLSVALSIGAYFTNAYLRTLITSLIREEATGRVASKASSRLFWCGVVMQVGSSIPY